MICVQVAPADALTLSLRHTSDLSRLARTSMVFLNPALDVLWSHQGTLVNLLRTMPGDLWDITETRDNGGNGEDDDAVPSNLRIALRRTATFADWDRFLFYSRRVQSLSVGPQDLETQEVYETLSSCFPEDLIFPRLRKLDWAPVTEETSHYVGLFLGPGITDLAIDILTIPDLSIFSTIADKCPLLTIVAIGTSFIPSVAAIPSVSKFVCALRHLESLVVADLNQAALAHIAGLPALRYLWLMSFNYRIPPVPPPPGSPHFPALTTLECEKMENAPALLEYLKPPLENFTLITRRRRVPLTKDTTRKFYSALASHCSHVSLQTITVQRGYYSEPVHASQLEEYTVGGDILRPLFCFRNLVSVWLDHATDVDLDDAVVKDMARAWPRIARLALPTAPDHRVRSRVTLEGIYAFAKRCPCLEELRIEFDATVVPKTKVNGRKRFRASQGSLFELDVASSAIGKARPVAKFLSAIFPSLDIIRTDESSVDPQDGALHKAWKKVEKALWDF
ncbi:hypothetical protein FB451DRAFT_1371392 [Mycena latifolia]|nr:hypothetical protein FB451DRAFT_1371392 [Mycena latifolia]